MILVIGAILAIVGGLLALGLGLLYDSMETVLLSAALFSLCGALGVWWLVIILEDVPDLLRKLDK